MLLMRSDGAPSRPPSSPSGGALRQVVSFAAIGVVSTAAYVGLYAALRNVSPAAAANALALVITAVGNTAANRRLTFDVRGRVGLARHHAAGLVALAVALALTSVSLATLDVVAPHRGRLTEIAVLVAANAAGAQGHRSRAAGQRPAGHRISHRRRFRRGGRPPSRLHRPTTFSSEGCRSR
jgi:putative flippase GtrA